MFIQKLIKDVAATTPAPTISSRGVSLVERDVGPRVEGGRDEASVQVMITGVATVKLFGRIDRTLPWVQLGSDVTASDIYPIARVPFVYAQVSSFTNGSVSVHAGV